MASRALANRKAVAFPTTVTVELANIEKDLGGRQQLVGMLMLAPLTPDLRYMLGMLGDPQHNAMSLAEVCALGNILPGELLRELSNAAMLRGKVLASQAIGQGIAAVTRDVMKKAAPYEDACNACIGTGSITPDPTPDQPNPRPDPCTTCNGTGRLLYQPDLDRQKLAIEMANLLPKGGGINIAMQQNTTATGGSSGGAGSLEQLQMLTDKLLYGDGGGMPPIDAEFAPAADPPEDVAAADPPPEVQP